MPEQFVIIPVRDYVVCHGSRDDAVVLQAETTERVIPKLAYAHSSPAP
jgi:hypothetical protein